MLTPERARSWLRRWDNQQQRHVPERENRFTVIVDVVESVAGRDDPLVVDLGAGPASLSARLLDRMPGARVVGVDADPLLLGLAAATYSDREGLRLVEHDLRTEGWVEALGLDRPADAIVSTTALHWLRGGELAALYRQCATVLRRGGVFVDGDHLYEGPSRPRLDWLAREVAARHAGRLATAVSDGAEDWQQWWQAIEADPEFTELAARRGPRGVEHHVPQPPTIDDHIRFATEAGFSEAGTVWQYGDDRVLVAVC